MELGKPLTAPSDIGDFRQKELRHLMKLVSYSLESIIRIVADQAGAEKLSEAARKARTDYYSNRGEDA